MPYNPFKAIVGFYSRLHKRVKNTMATVEKCHKQNIVIKWDKMTGKTKRVVYLFENGCSLDMPDDASSYDYSIVQKQFDVLKMKFK